MTGLLYRLGHACARWRFVVLGVWLVMVVALAVAAKGAGSDTTNNVTLPGTGSQSATDLLSGRFPSQAYGSNPLVDCQRQRQADRLEVLEGHQVVGERPQEDAARDGCREPPE